MEQTILTDVQKRTFIIQAVAPLLSEIMNSSLSDGVVPIDATTAKVILLFKSSTKIK